MHEENRVYLMFYRAFTRYQTQLCRVLNEGRLVCL